jgi:hypothetical protein
MIFHFPSTRSARHPPHNNKQGSAPAAIPVKKLVQAESFQAVSHISALELLTDC